LRSEARFFLVFLHILGLVKTINNRLGRTEASKNKEMIMRNKIFQAVLGLLIFCCITLAYGDELTNKVDKLFSKWDKPDSPGCALGVIMDGQLIYKRGYGMANLEHGIPITSKSVFRIGSTSKQFTAMCIVLLGEEGKLSLDDDIRKYINEMPDYGHPITIRHLLHHTSGIRDYLTLMSLAGERDDDFFVDGEVVALIARQKELNFKTGDEYLYSNSGYFLLSMIVKRVTGKSMRVYAEEKIFKPLKMMSTHFHDNHTRIVKNRAAGYSPQRKDQFRIDMTTLDMIGDGGIFTCIDDLLLWDRNFYDNKLGNGSPALIEKLLTQGALNNGKKLDYALGLVVSDYKGLRMISHGGAFVGFRADLIRFPEQRFSVIALANLGTINPSRLARQVADIYLADHFKVKTEKVSAEKPEFVRLTLSALKQKEGAYYNKKRDTVWRIFLEEEKLMVDASYFRFPISPISPTRFLAVEAPVEMELEFVRKLPEEPMVLKVYIEGAEPRNFEAFQLATPTPSELQQYLGDYHSKELGVTYSVVLENGKLFLHHENPYKGEPTTPLFPTFKDRFLQYNNHFQFFRDKKDEIEAFTMNAGRVRNIRFDRK